MDDAAKQLLTFGAQALGVSLNTRACERFSLYLDLLGRWNARINLTRIIEPREVIAKHFLDSLSIVAHLGTARTLIDVGSGGGFPGVPAAIAQPELVVTLVESIQKKCAFLEALRRELGLPLHILCTRLEDLAVPGDGFDVAVSRATLAPAEWTQRGARLVGAGGKLLVMLGRERPQLNAPPGFSPPVFHPYPLPAEGARAIAVLERKDLDHDVPRGT